MKLIASLFILLLIFSSCNSDQEFQLEKKESYTSYIPVDSLSVLEADSAIAKTIAPYKKELDKMMNRVIGTTDQEIFKNRPNGSLNNLAADMVLEMTLRKLGEKDLRPQICLLNYGGLRYPLPKGEVTVADIYQLMPFQNEAVVLELSGKQMKAMFKYLIDKNGQPISGLKLEASNQSLRKALIQGKEFDENQSYYIVTSDYLAEGGDQMSFLKEPVQSYRTGFLIRDLMIEYFEFKSQNNEIVKANIEERISIK